MPITSLALFEPPFIVDDSRPPMPASLRSELESLYDMAILEGTQAACRSPRR